MLVQAPGRLGPGTKHVLVGRQKARRPGTHLSAIRQAVAALWTRSGQEGGTKKAMGSLWCVVSEGLSPRNRRRNWGTQHVIKGRKHVSGGCQASAKALRQEPPLSLCGQSRTRGGRQDQVIGRGGGRCLCVEGCVGPCNPTDSSPPGSSVHGDSPGKNTGVGCRFLLQGIFLTQGLNPSLLHCRQTFYH